METRFLQDLSLDKLKILSKLSKNGMCKKVCIKSLKCLFNRQLHWLSVLTSASISGSCFVLSILSHKLFYMFSIYEHWPSTLLCDIIFISYLKYSIIVLCLNLLQDVKYILRFFNVSEHFVHTLWIVIVRKLRFMCHMLWSEQAWWCPMKIPFQTSLKWDYRRAQ